MRSAARPLIVRERTRLAPTNALGAHRAQLLRFDAERLGQPAQSGEVLGHGGRRTAGALERVT